MTLTARLLLRIFLARAVERNASSCESHLVPTPATEHEQQKLCGLAQSPGKSIFLFFCPYRYPSPMFLGCLVLLIPLSIFPVAIFVSYLQTMAAKTEQAVSIRAVSVKSDTPSRTWKGWLWDSADVSKEERRFLLKVGHCAGLLKMLISCTVQYLLNSLATARLHPFDFWNPWHVDKMGE